MKTLRISNSSLRALIDDEDYFRCSIYNWGFDGGGRVVRTTNPQIALAHFIMNTTSMYDHIDRDPLNNQKNNLRLCNKAQNAVNSNKRQGSYSSKYKGVAWYKPTNCWKAYSTVKGKQIHLGYFSNEENAARAYDKFVLRRFGEFAVLNLPTKGES